MVTSKQSHRLVRQGNIPDKIKSVTNTSASVIRWQLLTSVTTGVNSSDRLMYKMREKFIVRKCKSLGTKYFWATKTRISDSRVLIKGSVMAWRMHRVEDFSRNNVIGNERLENTCVDNILSREIPRSIFWSSKQNLFWLHEVVWDLWPPLANIRRQSGSYHSLRKWPRREFHAALGFLFFFPFQEDMQFCMPNFDASVRSRTWKDFEESTQPSGAVRNLGDIHLCIANPELSLEMGGMIFS